MFWLAELGKADNIWLFNGLNNIVDYCNAGAGIACQLNWSFSEKEVALYESEHTVALSCLHGAILPCVMQCLCLHTLGLYQSTRRLTMSYGSRSSCPLLAMAGDISGGQRRGAL